jgi:hypothetical protein
MKPGRLVQTATSAIAGCSASSSIRESRTRLEAGQSALSV